MRYIHYCGIAALATVAAAAVGHVALAQSASAPAPANPAAAQWAPITDPDAIIQLNDQKTYSGLNGLNQRGCVASPKVYGNETVAIDGYRYGGCLARGADKNLPAVRVLIKAAQATGQFRNVAYGFATNLATYLVLGDTTTKMRIEGSGTWQGESVKVRMDWDYRVPGVRFYITHANGSQDITVVADSKSDPTGRIGRLEQPEIFGDGPIDRTAVVAWKEKPVGVYGGAADISAQEVMALAYLMPSNIILHGRDAADKIQASKSGSNDVLTIPVPEFGGTNLVATLNADGQPVHAQIAVNGHTYTADFANYVRDRAEFEVQFPHQISIQRDGKPMADWQLDFHHANPYLVFPVPAQVASTK